MWNFPCFNFVKRVLSEFSTGVSLLLQILFQSPRRPRCLDVFWPLSSVGQFLFLRIFLLLFSCPQYLDSTHNRGFSGHFLVLLWSFRLVMERIWNSRRRDKWNYILTIKLISNFGRNKLSKLMYFPKISVNHFEC